MAFCAPTSSAWPAKRFAKTMTLLSTPAHAMARKLRLKRYRSVRAELEQLSEADLRDIGIKRYQLGHAARMKALA